MTWGVDRMDCTVSLSRGKHHRQFMIITPAPGALIRLHVGAGSDGSAFIFPGRPVTAPISTRAARARLNGWATKAGYAQVTRYGLTSALAESLRAAGVDDPSTQVALGRRHARSVDRLLSPHARLENQRRVQAALADMFKPLDSSDR